ncbi:hypothetical protein [Kribbella flavida]|uniref:hypothetical protein n=1 Tax=Kribbella flavida TaxID=182640 RepID=UPI00019BD97B|nr:hypothetical protein [Kribbella flavida]
MQTTDWFARASWADEDLELLAAGRDLVECGGLVRTESGGVDRGWGEDWSVGVVGEVEQDGFGAEDDG